VDECKALEYTADKRSFEEVYAAKNASIRCT